MKTVLKRIKSQQKKIYLTLSRCDTPKLRKYTVAAVRVSQH